jgi:hypothetical protein
MLKGRKKELWDKADAERQRCRQWLLAFIRPGQPKPITKAALRERAMRELKISKNLSMRRGSQPSRIRVDTIGMSRCAGEPALANKQ